MNGETILASRMLTQRVASHSPGEMVSLGIVRGGKNTDIRVALGVRPTGDELMRMDHVGTFAPAWSFTQSVGSAPSSLDSLRGRVVVLDFWATWCGPCRMMSPRLSALNARYGAQGLSVVGMTTDGPDEVAAFAQRHEMHYDLVLDTRGDTSRAYGVTGLPTVFVIDKRGVIREVSVGFDPSDDGLERIVRTLIAEKESLPGDPPDKPLQLPSKSPGPGRD